MSLRHKKFGGLLRFDHQAKTITLTRELNPPSYHARFVSDLQKNYPTYNIR
jgi:hypothetical protein